QAEDGIRDFHVTGVQTCALPISEMILKPLTKDTSETPGMFLILSFNSLVTCTVLSNVAPAGNSIFAKINPRSSSGTKPFGVVLRSEERRVGKERRDERLQQQTTQ